jgi:hypothetical protein
MRVADIMNPFNRTRIAQGEMSFALPNEDGWKDLVAVQRIHLDC